MSEQNEPLKSIIEHFYHWEKTTPDNVFLRQPKGDNWKTLTYAEAGQEARKMATALSTFGLQKGDHIGVSSKNCYHWILADLAIMMGGYVSVPFYASLPKQQLAEVIELSDIKAIFIGKLDKWGDRVDAIPTDVHVITFPHYEGSQKITIGEDWNELVAKNGPQTDNFVPNLADLWTIKFTSGTTGTPKGVMLAHRTPVIMMAHEKETNFTGLYEKPEFRCISYLPLNHVGERIGVELKVIVRGGNISFAENLETFAKNLRDVQPTNFFAVPRIWTKFYLGVMAKMPMEKLDKLLANPATADTVKKQIRANLGFSNIDRAATGAAITPVFLKEFYKKIDILLVEAYGMTEVSGSVTIAPTADAPPDSVGKARPFAEVKIHPETGEVLLKSPYVMMGYYKNPEKTAEVLVDGWIHSGDRGTIDEYGYLRIIGRVKDAFKTSKGSYVTPNPLEEFLTKNDYIEQICVAGLGIPQPIALVNLSEIGVAADKSEVENSILENVQSLNNQRAPFERISTVVIQAEAWTEANDCLTPTMKVRRSKLDDKFGGQYLAWHEAKEKIIWC